MTVRRFNIPKNVDAVKPCPKCGQKAQFVAKSQQVCEDGCEVWIECVCGHDPHKFNERFESVMGGCDEDNIRMALRCWNDASGHKATSTVRETSAKPLVCPLKPCAHCGGELPPDKGRVKGGKARTETLERIAEGLRNLDWCIGYELTEEQHVQLDALRGMAYSLEAQDDLGGDIL